MEGTIRPLTTRTYEEQGRPFSSSRKNIHSTHIFMMLYDAILRHVFDRGSRPGLACMLMLAWLLSAWPNQAQAAQCREQNRCAAGHHLTSHPASSLPKATLAPCLPRDWPSPQEWRPEAKAFVFALVFAFSVALWWGFLGIAVGLALSGFIGFGLTLLIFVLGGAAATWLASGVFHHLAGIERRWQKWLSRGIHLLLLLGLGLLVGYTWGVLLSALAVWLIAGMLLTFALISWGVFYNIARADP